MGQMKLIGSLVVLIIMVLSAVAFALSSAQYNQNTPVVQIPSIIDYELSPQEQIQILTTGRVIIENLYDQNCTNCTERNIILNGFATKMKDFVVLENVAGNETRLGIIGNGGRIVPMESNLTEESLLRTFCANAIAQPKECIMMTY